MEGEASRSDGSGLSRCGPPTKGSPLLSPRSSSTPSKKLTRHAAGDPHGALQESLVVYRNSGEQHPQAAAICRAFEPLPDSGQAKTICQKWNVGMNNFRYVWVRIARPNRQDARAAPSARQASKASSSGASLQVTLSAAKTQPAPTQSSSQVRIHSPSPQP